jgi:DNA-binding transcriptional LysR family regulator
MRLDTTQPAVSMQIKKLEALLSYAALDRSGRKALINEAGRKVLAHAHQIDVLLAQLRQGIADEDVTGLLRIGLISPSLLVDSIEAIALMVSGSQGVAIVLDTPSLKKVKLDLACISSGEDSLYRGIGLVARSDGARLHLVRQFWQALKPQAALVA